MTTQLERELRSRVRLLPLAADERRRADVLRHAVSRRTTRVRRWCRDRSPRRRRRWPACRCSPARATRRRQTSNSAWTKPTNCVHCLPVAVLVLVGQRLARTRRSASCVNGWVGVHQISLARPSPMSPSASTADENSTALAIVTSLGLKSCCLACVQNVAKSGGIGMPTTISTPSSLNWPMMLEKSSCSTCEATGVDERVARCGIAPAGKPVAGIGERVAVGIVGAQQADRLVGVDRVPHARRTRRRAARRPRRSGTSSRSRPPGRRHGRRSTAATAPASTGTARRWPRTDRRRG